MSKSYPEIAPSNTFCESDFVEAEGMLNCYLLEGHIVQGRVNLQKEFCQSWLGMKLRYEDCREHFLTFQSVLTTNPYHSLPDVNYRTTEREGFGFFSTGFSSLECGAYAAHILGAVLNPRRIRIKSPTQLSCTTKDICLRLLQHLPSAAFVQSLTKTFDHPNYKLWSEVRNVLSHRTMLDKDVFVGGVKDGEVIVTLPSGLTFNWSADTFRHLFTWLDESLTEYIRTARNIVHELCKDDDILAAVE